MDLKAATQFQAHVERAIREVSSALLLAQDGSSEEDLLAITRATGEIIARLDGLLHEAIYGAHPQLRTSGPYRFDEQDL
jgi:hypothetical protein